MTKREHARRLGWLIGQRQRERALALGVPLRPLPAEDLVARLQVRAHRAPGAAEREELIASYLRSC